MVDQPSESLVRGTDRASAPVEARAGTPDLGLAVAGAWPFTNRIQSRSFGRGQRIRSSVHSGLAVNRLVDRTLAISWLVDALCLAGLRLSPQSPLRRRGR